MSMQHDDDPAGLVGTARLPACDPMVFLSVEWEQRDGSNICSATCGEFRPGSKYKDIHVDWAGSFVRPCEVSNRNALHPVRYV